MNYSDRWQIIEELGAGGQGLVYRVLDKNRYDIDGALQPRIIGALATLSLPMQHHEDQRVAFQEFRNSITTILQLENPENYGALKLLHKPELARDNERAIERIKAEIKVMSETFHPSLLRILDVDEDSRWFVSQYYPRGTLAKNLDLFMGNIPRTLRAYRPLVEAVAELHGRNIVHRDIKPQNVFLTSKARLILGDFGIVFFGDSQHTRISGTFENVGSRDWMPAWAQGIRIDTVRPSFDVFSLGKLLWSMISGKPVLQLWYFARDSFNLESLFPENRHMKLVNRLLEKCVVEGEEDCISDAKALLDEVDKLSHLIETNAELIQDGNKRPCKVCGVGNYEIIADRIGSETHNFGLRPAGSNAFKVFTCNNCGHVQLFHFDSMRARPAWQ